MAIIVTTQTNQDASELLNDLQHDMHAGLFRIWNVDADGDFTHNSAQWGGKAFFRPKLNGDRIELNLAWRNKLAPNAPRIAIYAFYHGQFVETPLLSHYGRRFTHIQTSADLTLDWPEREAVHAYERK